MSHFFHKKFFWLLLLPVAFTVITLSVLFLVSYSYNHPISHETVSDETLNFPEGFLWGAATAAYQVEGGNFNSDWWAFERSGGKIENNDSARVATDEYNRYPEDFDLLKQLNLNAYRFSIEWSRIEPEKGHFNDNEIEHYRQELEALKARNITPMVTLWHFSLPKWFSEEGGWENGKSVEYFREYAAYVAESLGDEVDLWVTVNEPLAFISSGYIIGKWPPAKRDLTMIPRVLENIAKAHEQAYEAIHSFDRDASVGIAQYTSLVVPAGSGNFLESILAYGASEISNHYFVDRVRDKLDFLGLHYYFKQIVHASAVSNFLTESAREFEKEKLDRVYDPEGLFEILIRFKKYNLPIYITELGVQDSHPIPREEFIRDHVREIYYAIQAGVNVKGLFYWSLLDCFEWSEGYTPKFGLIVVNRDTLERTVKPSAYAYSDIAKCNCVGN